MPGLPACGSTPAISAPASASPKWSAPPRPMAAAIRIGVNAGSLEKDLLEKYGEPCPDALVESALDHIKLLQDHDFHEYKVAVKASDTFLAVAAYMQLAEAGRLPAAPWHHRGGRADRRHGQERDRHRQSAVGRGRRHYPRLAICRARGGSAGRLSKFSSRWASEPAACASFPAPAARGRAST